MIAITLLSLPNICEMKENDVPSVSLWLPISLSAKSKITEKGGNDAKLIKTRLAGGKMISMPELE